MFGLVSLSSPKKGLITSDTVDSVLQRLKPPSLSLRVIASELGSSEKFGCGSWETNPWPELASIVNGLPGMDATVMTSFGLPLSLSLAIIHDCTQGPELIAMLHMLYALVKESVPARDQLTSHGTVPVDMKSHSAEASALVCKIGQLCNDGAQEAGFQQSPGKDWTTYGGIREIWLGHEGRQTKVSVDCQRQAAGAYDMGGVHMTGGRVWAGSLVLARWLGALCLTGESSFNGEKLSLGSGPILELGAGLGLPGITLAKLGRRVVLSDQEPVLLDKLQENVDRNGVQDKCRILSLHWADAAEKKTQKLLKAQKFSAVIGAEVIYSERQVDLLIPLLGHALPLGGLALICSAKNYREGINSFVPKCRAVGHTVLEATIPVEMEMQELVCGSFEPNQEYLMIAVRIKAAA